MTARTRQRLTAAQQRAEAQAPDRWNVTYLHGIYQPWRCAAGVHSTRAAAQADADALNVQANLKNWDEEEQSK